MMGCGDHDGELRELLRRLLCDIGDLPVNAAEAIVAYGSDRAETLQQLFHAASPPPRHSASPPLLYAASPPLHNRSLPETDRPGQPTEPDRPR